MVRLPEEEEQMKFSFCGLAFFLSLEEKRDPCAQALLDKCETEGHPCREVTTNLPTPFAQAASFIKVLADLRAFDPTGNHGKVIEHVFREMESLQDADELCSTLMDRRRQASSSYANIVTAVDIERIAVDLEGDAYILEPGIPMEVKFPLLFAEVDDILGDEQNGI